MSMSRRRVVQIVSGSGKTKKIRGTGTLLGSNRILTARHVVYDDKDAPIPDLYVRRDSPEEILSEPLAATILWPGSNTIDIAVLEALVDGNDETLGLSDVLADRDVAADERVLAQGYPKVSHDDPTDTLEKFLGTALPYERGESLLEFLVDDQHINIVWRGLSGAAVLIDGRIVAVVCSYDERFRGTRLKATPVARFLHNDRFRKATNLPALRLERRPPKTLDWPEEPYPGLQPYEHPKLFRGRDDAREDILGQLDAGKFVVLLNAPSGIGKTSFLRAGLLPHLASQGRLAALVSKPEEPCIFLNILEELALCPKGFDISDDDASTFFEHVRHLRGDGLPPVFVLDPFEGVMRDHETRLATVAKILKETFARKGESGPFPCQWILAYRHEFDGPVAAWLTTFPEEMSSSEFLGRHDMKPIGAFGHGANDIEKAAGIFYDIIQAPLLIENENKYHLRFPDDDAQRLAEAFAAERCNSTDQVPLVPEFQAVLRHLITTAKVAEDGMREIHVPEDVQGLIANALNHYFKEEFEKAFDEPFDANALRRRAHGLCALRDVAEILARGDRAFVDRLKNNLADDGEDILKRLTKKARLLVEDRGKYDPRLYYVFPHESLPSIVSELFDVEAQRKKFSIDEELFKLYHRIPRLIEAHAHGLPWATELDDNEYLLIERRRKDLPWGSDRIAWWEECKKQQARKVRRSKTIAAGIVALVFLALLGAGWYVVVPYGNAGIARIEQAKTYNEAALAYIELHRLPWQEKAANAAMARWNVHASTLAAARGAWEEAMYRRLRALDLVEDEDNRRELRYHENLQTKGAIVRSGTAATLVLDSSSSRFPTHDGEQVLEIRPDGDQSVLTLWDVRTSLQASDEMVISQYGHRVASGNKIIAVADEEQIIVLDRFSGLPLCAPRLSETNDQVTELKVSTYGFWVFIQSKKSLRIWDASHCKESGVTREFSGALQQVSPMGDRFLVRNGAGNIELWSRASLTTGPEWVDRRVSWMKFDFLGHGAWIAGPALGSTLVLRAEDRKTICSIPEEVVNLDISPDERFILTGDHDGIRLWSVSPDTLDCTMVGQLLLISPTVPRLTPSPRFSDDGKSAIILDHDAVHFVDVSASGLVPRTTRRLGQRAFGGDVWTAQAIDSTTTNVQVLLEGHQGRGVPIGYWIETVHSEPPQEKIEGSAAMLLETWTKKLGIKERRFGILERD